MKAGDIVKIEPEAWRERNSFTGKIIEVTQSGAYVAEPYGKKRWSASHVYYDKGEIKYV